MHKINKIYALILFLIITIILIRYYNDPAVGSEWKTIVIDPGHGGVPDKLYTYNGEEFNGSINEAVKINESLGDNKEYFIKKDNLEFKNNKYYWLHAGDNGAVFEFNNVSYYEKEINLDISKKLARNLELYYETILIRNDDRYIFLERRVKIAKEANASLFLSIHQDSFSGNCSELNRANIYYNKDYLIDFANSIGNNLEAEMGFDKANVRKNENFLVLNSEIDSLLIEVNFMCNEQNVKFLSESANQDKIASIIAKTIINHGKENE